MRLKTTFVVIMFLLIQSQIKAIDPIFSQFFLYSPNFNPALAGSANEPRVFLHYRNQWPEFGGTFVTYQGSFDQYVKKIHGGIGLNIWHDQVGGAFSSTNIDLMYSYRSKINQKLTLQSAIQASCVFSSTSMELVNGGNFNLVSGLSSFQPDFAIGFLGMTRNSQIGFAIHHLNINGKVRFNTTSVVIPLKISLYYTRIIKIVNERKVVDPGYLVIPSVLVQKQAQSYNVQYGVGLAKRNVFTGVYFNNCILPFQFTSAIIAIGFTFGNIRLGYSYDYMLPSINSYTPITGAHEITLVKLFPVNPRKKKYSPVKCPEFKND